MPEALNATPGQSVYDLPLTGETPRIYVNFDPSEPEPGVICLSYNRDGPGFVNERGEVVSLSALDDVLMTDWGDGRFSVQFPATGENLRTACYCVADPDGIILAEPAEAELLTFLLVSACGKGSVSLDSIDLRFPNREGGMVEYGPQRTAWEADILIRYTQPGESAAVLILSRENDLVCITTDAPDQMEITQLGTVGYRVNGGDIPPEEMDQEELPEPPAESGADPDTEPLLTA